MGRMGDGDLVQGLGQLVCAAGLVVASVVDCDPAKHTVSPHRSQFLEDVATYLTGSSQNAQDVFTAYKHRTNPNDPKLVYPPSKPAIAVGPRLEDLWEDLELGKEDFGSSPPSAKWQTSTSGKWKRRLIAKSVAKGLPRWIYRHIKKDKTDIGISVAKTQNETEFAIQRAGSNDWDFFAYNDKGELSAESKFVSSTGKTITAPAPLTCLSCHYHRGTRTFRNFALQ